jgi:peptide/nickel transport system substrate-binding protein
VWSYAPDATTAATRLFSGDADMFEQLRPEHLAQLKTDTVRHAFPYAQLLYTYFGMNLVDPSNSARPHPIFGDRAVRRALSMAVDRRAMLQNVFGSYGQIAYGPFPHAMGIVDTTLPQIGYDTARARTTLDSAGWVMGPGGVRAKGGRKLEFSLILPNSSAPRKAYAVLLQEAFKKIGASMKIDETDFPTYVARQGARTFDASMISYGTDPSVSGFKQSWGTAGVVKDGLNYTAYSNPVVDALLDSAITTFDVARARSYTRRALETIMDDAPGIWLYEPMTMAGIDKRIHTTAMRADGYWSGMADWWIPVGQRTARDKIGLRPAN